MNQFLMNQQGLMLQLLGIIGEIRGAEEAIASGEKSGLIDDKIQNWRMKRLLEIEEKYGRKCADLMRHFCEYYGFELHPTKKLIQDLSKIEPELTKAS